MPPLSLRHLRARVASQPPMRRAALTFAWMFVTSLIVIPLADRAFQYISPGPLFNPWHVVVEAACGALVVSPMGYFGIMWSNGPARRDS